MFTAPIGGRLCFTPEHVLLTSGDLHICIQPDGGLIQFIVILITDWNKLWLLNIVMVR